MFQNDPLNTIKSLTDEEIVYTIHHVLQAISIKGFNKDKKNLSDISHNANVTTIPETLTSIKYESNTEDRLFLKTLVHDLTIIYQYIFFTTTVSCLDLQMFNLFVRMMILVFLKFHQKLVNKDMRILSMSRKTKRR